MTFSRFLCVGALACVFAAGCGGSDSGGGGGGGTGGGGNNSGAGGSSSEGGGDPRCTQTKCVNDVNYDLNTKAVCDNLLNPSITPCVTEYSAWIACARKNDKCDADQQQDTTAVTQACNAEWTAYRACQTK